MRHPSIANHYQRCLRQLQFTKKRGDIGFGQAIPWFRRKVRGEFRAWLTRVSMHWISRLKSCKRSKMNISTALVRLPESISRAIKMLRNMHWKCSSIWCKRPLIWMYSSRSYRVILQYTRKLLLTCSCWDNLSVDSSTSNRWRIL